MLPDRPQITNYNIQTATTATFGILNLWPLLTGGRCSEVGLCYYDLNWDSKMAVAVGRWSLTGLTVFSSKISVAVLTKA
jgi:hypothetical protein